MAEWPAEFNEAVTVNIVVSFPTSLKVTEAGNTGAFVPSMRTRRF
jgi:hypothetical protein